MNLNLKSRIVLKHGTQADFAQKLDIDEALVSRVIRGRRQLDPEKQRKWARALDTDPADLFGGNHGGNE